MILKSIEAKVAFEGFHSIDRFKVLDTQIDRCDIDIWRGFEETNLVIVLYKSLHQHGFVGPPSSDLIFLHIQQLLEYFLLHLAFPDQLLGRGGHCSTKLTRLRSPTERTRNRSWSRSI